LLLLSLVDERAAVVVPMVTLDDERCLLPIFCDCYLNL
jgi:hypothetical protein